MFGAFWKVLKLLVLMAATSATSEWSFSAPRRIKTYLRSTMLQERLHSLMILAIQKERTNKFSLLQVAQQFVSEKEVQISEFAQRYGSMKRYGKMEKFFQTWKKYGLLEVTA